MRIGRATFEIRPRKISEILDLALLFYRTHLSILFQITMIIGIPCIIATTIVHYLTGEAWVAILLFWLLCPIIHGAIILTASRLVFDTKLTARSALRIYRPFSVDLFLRSTGQNLLFLVTAPLVVGFVYKLGWVYTPMIVMLERLSGKEIDRRRRGLSRRYRGGSPISLSLVLYLVSSVVLLAVATLFELVLGDFLNLYKDIGLFTDYVLYEPEKLALWFLCALFVLPFFSLSCFFHYLDARIRGEGWDIELGFKSTVERMAKEGGRTS